MSQEQIELLRAPAKLIEQDMNDDIAEIPINQTDVVFEEFGDEVDQSIRSTNENDDDDDEDEYDDGESENLFKRLESLFIFKSNFQLDKSDHSGSDQSLEKLESDLEKLDKHLNSLQSFVDISKKFLSINK
jgi:hypothetical protein